MSAASFLVADVEPGAPGSSQAQRVFGVGIFTLRAPYPMGGGKFFGADCPAHIFHHSTILIRIRKNLLLKNISKSACQAPIHSSFYLTGAITATYPGKIVGVTVMVNGVQ